MLEAITSRWWVLVVRGLAAILFAMAAVTWPQISLSVLVMLFGVYALVDGIAALAWAANPLAGSRWWALLIEGILGLVVAFYVFTQPALSDVAFVYAVAFWSIFTGILEIVAGIQLRDVIDNEWTYIIAGIVSIAFGVLVVRNPLAGAVGVVWLFAGYAVLFGVLELALGYRLQRMHAATKSAHA